ncbi:MAG TPA: hypothetical protein VK892_09630 [Pyrinomonadaceae bacterium]|nr:hypothetical protein [Pyrinomonadaceae bacterium]
MEVFQTRIEPGGKIQLPQKVLEQLNLKAGQDLDLEVEEKSLRLSLTRAERLKKAQDLVGKYINPEVSLADELIEDRRREAEND